MPSRPSRRAASRRTRSKRHGAGGDRPRPAYTPGKPLHPARAAGAASCRPVLAPAQRSGHAPPGAGTAALLSSHSGCGSHVPGAVGRSSLPAAGWRHLLSVPACLSWSCSWSSAGLRVPHSPAAALPVAPPAVSPACELCSPAPARVTRARPAGRADPLRPPGRLRAQDGGAPASRSCGQLYAGTRTSRGRAACARPCSCDGPARHVHIRCACWDACTPHTCLQVALPAAGTPRWDSLGPRGRHRGCRLTLKGVTL